MRNLERLPTPKFALRFGWLALLAFGAQLLVIYLDFGDARRIVFPLSYVLLLAFIALNRRHIGLWVIAIGLILNLLPIVANGGLMPVSPDSMVEAGLEEELLTLEPGDPVPRSKNVLLSENDTHLQWLSDRLAWGLGPFRVISVGDLVIFAGLLVTLAEMALAFVSAERKRPLSAL